jgi:EAL domain-containing protein (putative c-di-GMP-specific phosphodiesterase class I)
MEFIPIAEEYGLIIPISEWVINTACQQIAQWNKAGFKDMKVAVNLSTRDLESEDMLSIIKRSIKKAGISSKSLEIEITETAIMGDINAAIDVLQSMKDYGISVAIDDFGTGYSSLNYLKRLPISLVKIDKSFIDGLSSSKIDYAMVFSIISLAHILGDEVVAEGVEDLETIKALKAMSCDYIQGYYYSRPVSPEEILIMLKKDIRLVTE